MGPGPSTPAVQKEPELDTLYLRYTLLLHVMGTPPSMTTKLWPLNWYNVEFASDLWECPVKSNPSPCIHASAFFKNLSQWNGLQRPSYYRNVTLTAQKPRFLEILEISWSDPKQIQVYVLLKDESQNGESPTRMDTYMEFLRMTD